MFGCLESNQPVMKYIFGKDTSATLSMEASRHLVIFLVKLLVALTKAWLCLEHCVMRWARV